MTKAARVQLSVIAAVLMLLIAANYWLDQYSVLTSQGDRFEGASYTDVNAVIPSKQILAAVAVLVALMFVFTAVRGTWRVPALGVGLMVVGAVAIGGIYPAVVQRFQVNPNQQESEAPYIQRNIDATLAAYNLEDVEVSSYNAKTDATPGALREDAETTASIRLLDPQEVSPSFRQLEQIRGFYSFADTLSVDRYEIDGESRDTVIAVREIDLDGLDANRRNWNSDATIYTHGYGVVAAYGNTTTSTGAPDFWEPASRPPVSSASTSRGSTSARTRRSTRSSVPRRGRTAGSSTTRATTPRTARSPRPSRPTRSRPARRSATCGPSCCTRSSSAPSRSCSPTGSTPSRRSSTTVTRSSGCRRSPRT